MLTEIGLLSVLFSARQVNGYFTLATEAHSDDGCPHCLEHLVFLGSEQYPFKGVLDSLATRCLCNGTNAWTAVDHTCYTVTTAGSEGFLNLLPVYLDHILYPTLTDAAFTTEVCHARLLLVAFEMPSSCLLIAFGVRLVHFRCTM